MQHKREKHAQRQHCFACYGILPDLGTTDIDRNGPASMAKKVSPVLVCILVSDALEMYIGVLQL